MEFRTKIEIVKGWGAIDHTTRIVMLGSCFSTEIGDRMCRDGFDVCCNPMGVLYNPASIARVVDRAIDGVHYRRDELVYNDGRWHCMDFYTIYQDSDADVLLKRVNDDLDDLGNKLADADLLVVTFGTSWVFEMVDADNDNRCRIVGNCHKLPASMFNRRRMQVDEIAKLWTALINKLDCRVMMTVSPIRHTADGLHGNQLSKSTLLLAIDKLEPRVEYFPSYEILLDDLRDYRFYARDMKHPGEIAVDYIYEKFGETYFDKATLAKAMDCRKVFKRSQHRPIL